MKSKTFKAKAHAARSQRKRDARRDQRKRAASGRQTTPDSQRNRYNTPSFALPNRSAILSMLSKPGSLFTVAKARAA